MTLNLFGAGRYQFLLALCAALVTGSSGFASVSIDLIETGDDPIADLTGALVPGSGVSVVAGTESFVGNVGNGDEAQSGTFTDLNLTPNNAGLPTVSLASGVVLTTGSANLPSSNTSTAFDGFIPGTGSSSSLSTLLSDAGAPSSDTNDTNSFSFDFTVAAGINAIALDFVFGSDEFPDQSITDVFGVFVDGVNFAFFQDGSLISFVTGTNASNFIDNDFGTGNYDFELDGFSEVLSLVGLLDMSRTTHTLELAIADTSDNVFQSGVFIGNLRAGMSMGGGGGGVGGGGLGGNNGEVPEPVSAAVWAALAGFAGVFAGRRAS